MSDMEALKALIKHVHMEPKELRFVELSFSDLIDDLYETQIMLANGYGDKVGELLGVKLTDNEL